MDAARRWFLTRLSLAILAASSAASAQARARIGLLGDLPWEPLKDGLRELGYVEGKTVVASLSQPGGNVTGLMQFGAGLAAKRMELLKEIVPAMSRLAFLWNPANPDQKSHFNEAQTAARSLGVKGASPAALPVEQPTTFELVINLKTAKALGLTIPPSLLLRADQIIQ